jgi:hypothetical protein
MSEDLTMREILSGHVHTRVRGTNMQAIAEYPHLFFSDLEHFNKALEFATSNGDEALRSLKESLASLERICINGGKTAEVFPDFVAHSFYFRTYRKDGSDGIDGGIILHGLTQSFSIELIPKPGLHWSMHT